MQNDTLWTKTAVLCDTVHANCSHVASNRKTRLPEPAPPGLRIPAGSQDQVCLVEQTLKDIVSGRIKLDKVNWYLLKSD